MTTADSPRGRLLSGVAAAKRLGIGYDALLRLVAAKRIAHQTHDGGRLAGIYEVDCDAYIERTRVRAVDSPHVEPSRFVHSSVDDEVAALLQPHERMFG